MKKNWEPNTCPRGGFTFLEILALTGVLMVFAAVALPSLVSVFGRTENVKLEGDVKTLNTAVKSYLTFGGLIYDDDTAVTVIQKLKTVADEESTLKVIGLTGRFIDPRIEVVMQNTEEAETDMARVHWDGVAAKFVITAGGEKGIKRFQFNNELAEGEDEEEARVTLLGYSAEQDSWVWDFRDRPEEALDGLTTVDTAGHLTFGPPDGSGPIVPTYGSVAPSTKNLSPPTFSPPGGISPITDFDIPVYLNNPNPPGISTLQYSINGGEWVEYTGASIDVSPATVIRGKAVTIAPNWDNSGESQEFYDAGKPSGTLAAPNVTLSDPEFTTGSLTEVTVTIANPNDPDVSRIDYRLDGGTWLTYSGPFTVNQVDYPTGFTVESYAASTSVYWENSELATGVVGVSDPAPYAIFCGATLKNYGATILDGGKLKIDAVDSGIDGHVAIAPGGEWDTKQGAVTGTFFTHAGTSGNWGNADDQFGPGGDDLVPVLADLSALEQQALDMSFAAAALPADQTYEKIEDGITLYADNPNGLTVINVEEVNLDGSAKVLTIQGDADDYVVINVSKKIQMRGGSTWRIAGGLKISRVLFNMLPGADDFEGTGNSGEVTGGVILAPHGGSDVKLSGSSVIKGTVVTAGNFEIKGGAQLLASACE